MAELKDVSREPWLSRSVLLPGDLVPDGTIVGFAFVPAGDTACAVDDRVLLAGEETLESPPPERSLDGTSVLALGPAPYERLPEEQVHLADDIAPGLRETLAVAVKQAQEPYGGFLERLIGRVDDAGYGLWHIGGSVRDVVVGGAGVAPRDLDMAGTAPAGWFSERVRECLVLSDASDLRQKVSDTLVCSLAPAGRERILEYKPLALRCRHLRASGGDPRFDAAGRDLTVNSLYLDAADRRLLDPTGRALADLTGSKRRLVTLHNDPADPLGAATVLVRAVKFLARWRAEGVPVDHEPVALWAKGLPHGLLDEMPAERLNSFRVHRARTLEEFAASDVLAAAVLIGPSAVSVLEVPE